MHKNKVVFVTGGTKGIGKSIVKSFLNNNAKVITVYSHDDTAAKKLKASTAPSKKDSLFIQKGCIEDRDFLNEIFGFIKSKFGKIDILINNAGINRDNLFIEMTENEWDDVLNINLKGTLNTTLMASELMKETKSTSYIINISSISGFMGRAAQVNYACTKGAIIGMTKLLAKKLFSYNIQVNTVIPGLIKTDMVQQMPQEKIEEIINATVMHRMGTAEEISNVILWLASKYSSYITGTCINIDGGFLK